MRPSGPAREPARQLCVTADDYGMHSVVNAAIEELAENRQISAVAVMVHDGAALDSLDRLRATGIATGLHLVLTQERPLDPGLKGTSLARGGTLPESPYQLAVRLLRRPSERALLFRELDAQVRRYRELGLPLEFINAHEHVHEIPIVWSGIARLIDRERPAAVRAARAQPIRPGRQGALAALSRISARLRTVRAPLATLSPLGAGRAGQMSLGTVRTLVEHGLQWHEDGTALPELVVHPATADHPLSEIYGDKVGKRQAEYDLLRSAALQHLWNSLGVELLYR